MPTYPSSVRAWGVSHPSYRPYEFPGRQVWVQGQQQWTFHNFRHRISPEGRQQLDLCVHLEAGPYHHRHKGGYHRQSVRPDATGSAGKDDHSLVLRLDRESESGHRVYREQGLGSRNLGRQTVWWLEMGCRQVGCRRVGNG